MEFRLGEIHALVGGELDGDPGQRLTGLRSLEAAGPDDLSFVRGVRFTDSAHQSRAGALLVPPGGHWERPVIVVDNPEVAVVKVLHLISRNRGESCEGRHPTAVVDADAVLASDVSLDAYVLVKSDVRIDARTRIGAHSTIGSRTRIGSDVWIFPNVTIYSDVEIGNRVIIHSGCVIGADGFGYVQDGSRHVKIPHVGKVLIEDDVEIGAACTIDRGMLEATVIRRGVKIDDQCHLAHNCHIGENTLVAGASHFSGSTHVGARVLIGGGVETSDNITIGDDAKIGGGTQVFSNVPAGGSVWHGIPGREGMIAKKIAATLPYLPDLRQAVRRILKHLGMDEGSHQRRPR